MLRRFLPSAASGGASGRVPARVALAVLLVPLALAGGCKKKKPVEDDGDSGDGVAMAYDAPLAVSSLRPSTAEPQTPLDATLRGDGFGPDARVAVGGVDAAVRFRTEQALDLTIPGLPEGRHDLVVTLGDGTSATLRGALTVAPALPSCESATVHFALDSANLPREELAVLEKHAACWIDSGARLTIEGHCDERGTTDYNLALGQRRADSVVRWLIAEGLPADRLRAVTYGEERPVDTRSTEAAWKKNRRAEVRFER